jgi:murein DD-endopeptidase MepM/ murein hydrolase activator NlpD
VNDIAALLERARAAQKPADPAAPGFAERQRLERVAQEFESMLLVQMLRDMRKSGQWDEADEKDTLGAESMYDTLDVELAGHLAKVQGFGLSQQLLQAFDRMNAPTANTSGLDAPSHVAPSHVAPSDAPSDAPSVTSDFGWRSDPFTGKAKFHKGVDLRAAYGQEIGAAAGGRVVFSGQQGGYGTTVLVEHPDGSRTRYAHLSEALVSAGDAVAYGQPLGRAGHSGRATGTHLHFEVIAANGQHVDPSSGGKA